MHKKIADQWDVPRMKQTFREVIFQEHLRFVCDQSR